MACVTLDAAGAIAVPRPAIVRTPSNPAGGSRRAFRRCGSAESRLAMRPRSERRRALAVRRCRSSSPSVVSAPIEMRSFVTFNERRSGNRLEVDDVARRPPVLLQLVEQVAAAGHERAVLPVTRGKIDRLVERTGREQLERERFVSRDLPHATPAFRLASARRTHAARYTESRASARPWRCRSRCQSPQRR